MAPSHKHKDSAKIIKPFDDAYVSTPVSEKSASDAYNNRNYSNEDFGGMAVEEVEHVPEGTASPGKALFMLLKAFVGTGVIFLPGA